MKPTKFLLIKFFSLLCLALAAGQEQTTTEIHLEQQTQKISTVRQVQQQNCTCVEDKDIDDYDFISWEEDEGPDDWDYGFVRRNHAKTLFPRIPDDTVIVVSRRGPAPDDLYDLIDDDDDDDYDDYEPTEYDTGETYEEFPLKHYNNIEDLLYRPRRKKNKNKNKKVTEVKLVKTQKPKKKKKKTSNKRGSHGHSRVKSIGTCYPEKKGTCLNLNATAFAAGKTLCDNERDYCSSDCQCPSYQKCCTNQCGKRECMPSIDNSTDDLRIGNENENREKESTSPSPSSSEPPQPDSPSDIPLSENWKWQ